MSYNTSNTSCLVKHLMIARSPQGCQIMSYLVKHARVARLHLTWSNTSWLLDHYLLGEMPQGCQVMSYLVKHLSYQLISYLMKHLGVARCKNGGCASLQVGHNLWPHSVDQEIIATHHFPCTVTTVKIQTLVSQTVHITYKLMSCKI